MNKGKWFHDNIIHNWFAYIPMMMLIMNSLAFVNIFTKPDFDYYNWIMGNIILLVVLIFLFRWQNYGEFFKNMSHKDEPIKDSKGDDLPL